MKACQEEQQEKMLMQSRNVFGASPIGLLLSGRTQVYAAVLGVMDRPIFGFGSWRHDLTSAYVVEALAEVGTDPAVFDIIIKVLVKIKPVNGRLEKIGKL